MLLRSLIDIYHIGITACDTIASRIGFNVKVWVDRDHTSATVLVYFFNPTTKRCVKTETYQSLGAWHGGGASTFSLMLSDHDAGPPALL